MEMRVEKGRATEDRVTGAIESNTSQVPSSGYLAAALGSMAGSLILKFAGQDEWALLVGQWAARFLIMGVYNNMVKTGNCGTRLAKWFPLANRPVSL